MTKDCSLFSNFKYTPLLFVALMLGCATTSKNSNDSFCHPYEDYKDSISCSIENLPSELKAQLNTTLTEGIHNILSKLNPPKYDGGKYKGEITICLNRDGVVEKAVVNEPSGHKALDSTFLDAVFATEKVIIVPQDDCSSDLLYFMPVVLNYDETDMAQ